MIRGQSPAGARNDDMSADLILRNGSFTTLDPSSPTATAVAVTDGLFAAVGRETEIMGLAGPKTRIVDLKGRRVLPGLIDNHLHIIRSLHDLAAAAGDAAARHEYVQGDAAAAGVRCTIADREPTVAHRLDGSRGSWGSMARTTTGDEAGAKTES